MRTRNREIGPGHSCYFIAEMSHNHQGNGNIALELIKEAASAGADAVKFQKRNNSTLYSSDFYNKAYENKNSFGATYGEHREFLEPKKEWLREANELAHDLGMDFIITAFDLDSLAFCEANLDVDAYKIQSADLTFDALITAVAQTRKPYFISCGAASLSEIKNAHGLCISLQTPFCMMYAVSAYPTPADNLNLARIGQLKTSLTTGIIGYSCHYEGISPSVFARMLGCVAIEKHFTLDKTQKGPDHTLSLTPAEFAEMVKRIAEADIMSGSKWQCENFIEPYQLDARYKMGKSPVAVRDLDCGETIYPADVSYLSPAKGISPAEMKNYFGLPLKRPLHKGCSIQQEHFN